MTWIFIHMLILLQDLLQVFYFTSQSVLTRSFPHLDTLVDPLVISMFADNVMAFLLSFLASTLQSMQNYRNSQMFLYLHSPYISPIPRCLAASFLRRPILFWCHHVNEIVFYFCLYNYMQFVFRCWVMDKVWRECWILCSLASGWCCSPH